MGGAVELSASNNYWTSLNQTFLRPLTFGFRAVKFVPEPAKEDDVKEGCKT